MHFCILLNFYIKSVIGKSLWQSTPNSRQYWHNKTNVSGPGDPDDRDHIPCSLQAFFLRMHTLPFLNHLSRRMYSNRIGRNEDGVSAHST